MRRDDGGAQEIEEHQGWHVDQSNSGKQAHAQRGTDDVWVGDKQNAHDEERDKDKRDDDRDERGLALAPGERVRRG